MTENSTTKKVIKRSNSLSELLGRERARATETPPLIPAQVRIGTAPGFNSELSDLIFTGNAMAKNLAKSDKIVIATNKLIKRG